MTVRRFAKQASCKDAVRPNPPVQIGETISDHCLGTNVNTDSVNSPSRDHQKECLIFSTFSLASGMCFAGQ